MNSARNPITFSTNSAFFLARLECRVCRLVAIFFWKIKVFAAWSRCWLVYARYELLRRWVVILHMTVVLLCNGCPLPSSKPSGYLLKLVCRFFELLLFTFPRVAWMSEFVADLIAWELFSTSHASKVCVRCSLPIASRPTISNPSVVSTLL